MIYVLVGPDDYSISQRLKEIKESIGDADLLVANTAVFDGDKVSPAELRAAVETVPFLAPKRLVVVERLLRRFEAGGRSEKPAAAGARRNGSQPFAESLAGLPQSTVVVLVDGVVSPGNPLLKALADRAEVSYFPLLKGSPLKQWINQRVAREGGSIDPLAVTLLARLVGGNLWVMASEITKLVLYAPNRRIEEADVRTLVSYARETSVFALVDAILEPAPALAEKLLQQLLREGAAAAYLLYMLYRQLHLIIRAREMKHRRRPEAEIRSQLGLSADFAFRKTLEQARRYPLARVKVVFERLLETDLAIKTGKCDGELALNILVAELGQGRFVG